MAVLRVSFIIAFLMFSPWLPIAQAGKGESESHFKPVHGHDQWTALDKSGLLQLLGEVLVSENLALASKFRHMLLDRGMAPASVDKLSTYLTGNHAWDSWVKARMQVLDQKSLAFPNRQVVNAHTLQAISKSWADRFYDLLNNQEARVLEAFMREVFSESVVQWQAKKSDVGPGEPYLLQSFAYLEVPNGGKPVWVRHLVSVQSRPTHEGEVMVSAAVADHYPFIMRAPALIKEIPPHRMYALSSGFYFSTRMVP